MVNSVMISGWCHFSLLFICRSLMSVFVICALNVRFFTEHYFLGLYKPNSRQARASIFVLKDRTLAPPERRGIGWNLLSVSVQMVLIKVSIVNGTLRILEFFPSIFPASGVPALTAGLRIACMFWWGVRKHSHTRARTFVSFCSPSQVNARRPHALARFN